MQSYKDRVEKCLLKEYGVGIEDVDDDDLRRAFDDDVIPSLFVRQLGQEIGLIPMDLEGLETSGMAIMTMADKRTLGSVR